MAFISRVIDDLLQSWRRGRSTRKSRSCLGQMDHLERRLLHSVDLNPYFSIDALNRVDELQPGTEIVVPLILLNDGSSTHRGAIETDFYLQPIDSEGPVALIFLGRRTATTTLPPRDGVELDFNLSVPASLRPGTYRFVAELDPRDRVAESDETNNRTVSYEEVRALQGSIDLTVEVTKATIPAAVIAGASAKGSLQLTLRNTGGLALPSGQEVAVEILARPIGGGQADVRLNPTPVTINVSKLAGNRAARKTVALVFPDTLPVGDYEVVVQLDVGNSVGETSEANNSVIVSEMPITVASPFVDLTGQVSSRLKIPSAVVSGDQTKLNVPLEVRNDGNVPLAKGQEVDLRLFAQRLGDAAQFELDSILGQSISGLKPGAVKKLNLKPTLPAGLPDGEYRLVAVIDSNNALDESDETNNNVATSDTDAITVAEGFVDLTGAFSSRLRLPRSLLSNDGTTFRLPLEITNRGNMSTARDLAVDIALVARRTTDGQETDLGSAGLQRLGTMRPGAAKKVTLNVSLPEGLDGHYEIVAYVDSGLAGGQVKERDESNNVAITPANATIAVAPDFLAITGYDLVGRMWTYAGRLTAGGDIAVEGSGTLESTVLGFGDDTFIVQEFANTEGGSFENEEQTFSWQRRDDGVYLLDRRVGVDLGSLRLTFDHLRVSPDSLKLRERFSDTSPVTASFSAAGVRLVLEGEAVVTTSLDGYRTVTTPFGRYEGAKVTYTFSFTATGERDSGGNHYDALLKYSESISFVAVPGVGVIQSTNRVKASFALRGPGGASASASGMETRFLVATV